MITKSSYLHFEIVIGGLMKKILLVLTLLSAYSFANIGVSGSITDVYCGAIDKYTINHDFTQGRDHLGEQETACIFFIDSNEKIAIVVDDSSYTRFVPSNESTSVLLGRSIKAHSCEPIKKNINKVIKISDLPKDIRYVDCYPSYVELVNTPELGLDHKKLEGELSNSRDDSASISIENFMDRDLFSAATFYFTVELEHHSYGEIYLPEFSSEDLLYVANERRPYYVTTFNGECDDPDCYVAEGTLTIFVNKDGSYTTKIDAYYYNYAPTEEQEGENEFDGTIYLTK